MATPAPMLIAHRGHPCVSPENTLEGIVSAIDAGVRHIEFDVQSSADGVPVVIHDEDLERTAGIPGCVLDLPWSTLAEIDVHEPGRFGNRYAGVRLPALTEAVSLLLDHPGVTAFVELKRESLRRFGSVGVVARVAEIVAPLGDRAVMISFDDAAVELAKEHGVRIGWVLDAWDATHRTRAQTLEPEFLFCDRARVPAAPAPMWPGPWAWAIYTVDEPEVALELGRRSVPYVETNAIGAMLADARLGG